MKKISLFLIILIIPFILTGCYDSVGLEQYYYAIAIGIDQSATSNLKLSIQVASSSKNSDSSSSQSTTNQIYSTDCESIAVGINIINNYLSKRINLSHCSAIIFSEDISKQGIKEYINALANNPEIRPDTHVLVCSSKTTDILENVSKAGEQFSSRYYEFVINSVESTGYASQSEFGKFFYDINNENQTPTANYITVSNGTVQSIGIAVFKNEKFDYNLDSMNSLAHLILNNRLKESVLSINNPFDSQNKIDIDLKKGKQCCTSQVKLINGKPFIKTKVFVTGRIANLPSFGENDNIKIIETELNHYLKEIIEIYYYTIIKEHNSDLSNLSDNLSNHYLTLDSYKKVNFNEILKDSFYEVSVESNLSTGLFKKK